MLHPYFEWEYIMLLTAHMRSARPVDLKMTIYVGAWWWWWWWWFFVRPFGFSIFTSHTSILRFLHFFWSIFRRSLSGGIPKNTTLKLLIYDVCMFRSKRYARYIAWSTLRICGHTYELMLCIRICTDIWKYSHIVRTRSHTLPPTHTKFGVRFFHISLFACVGWCFYVCVDVCAHTYGCVWGAVGFMNVRDMCAHTTRMWMRVWWLFCEARRRPEVSGWAAPSYFSNTLKFVRSTSRDEEDRVTPSWNRRPKTCTEWTSSIKRATKWTPLNILLWSL